MDQSRHGSRSRSLLPARWLPTCAIVLGLLSTAALGRLVSATWTLLQDNVISQRVDASSGQTADLEPERPFVRSTPRRP